MLTETSAFDYNFSYKLRILLLCSVSREILEISLLVIFLISGTFQNSLSDLSSFNDQSERFSQKTAQVCSICLSEFTPFTVKTRF